MIAPGRGTSGILGADSAPEPTSGGGSHKFNHPAQSSIHARRVGQRRNAAEIAWQGTTVSTGIFKDPVADRVAVRTMNLAGDAQADLSVHGGPDKAIYAYPAEHYRDWEAKLGRQLFPGAFGENLTTEGLFENRVHIGDEFRVGTARLVATQPRMPCFKLGIRFGDPEIVPAFLDAGRPGIYFAVLEEGAVGPGDAIEKVHTDQRRITVSDMRSF